MTDFIDFELVCEQLPLGVLVLDGDHRIRYWNDWLVQKSGVTAGQALGTTLEALFGEGGEVDGPPIRQEAVQRFYWAVDQAVAYKIPQLLSQALNHFLIPVPIPRSGRHGLPMMQQQVKVVPLAGRDGATYAVVIVQDVTENVIRSSAMTEMVQQFRETSLRDPLTNLFNRRFMWEWLVHHVKEAGRYHSHVACLMLDIDRFKPINDTYGHQRGDEILKDFARIVSDELRESDILVRYGGEEFAAFLPKCDGVRAVATAGRILETVRATRVAGLDAGTVTCSIGVAVYDPDRPISTEELLREADRRLYEAKRSGRDRVVPAEGDAAAFPEESDTARDQTT